MSEDATETPAATTTGPKRKQFRKYSATRMAPESAERQGKIALLAWNLLGGDAAIAFLNTHNDELGGRPLDLAVASAAGCEAVERALAARAGAE